jgi:dTDP-4-dehydrorhamnose 3,5-epimerase
MLFRPTPLDGAVVVEIEPHRDARGFFARSWCSQEFEAAGLNGTLVQSSFSHNVHRGTVRGMHLQLPPSREAKLVRCGRGAIYDVIVDLRPDSPTYLQHFGIELSARTYTSLYIPPLMAHGFQTLEDTSEVMYQMSDVYAPDLAAGFRWNDPAFAIRWPIEDPAAVTIAPRDRDYPDFDATVHAARLAAGGSLSPVPSDSPLPRKT